jgi:hypothetical protein
MRVCEAHREKAVQTLKSTRDDSEYDLCETCYEAFMLIASGAMFRSPDDAGKPRRGRPPKPIDDGPATAGSDTLI